MSSATPDSERTVRVGLVGVGGHGRTLQKAAAEAANVHAVSVFDPDREEATRAGEFLDAAVETSFETLIGRSDLDAVVIASPNALHRTQAEAALKAGLDVLVEKPITETVSDGLAMVDLADQTERILMVGHNMRYGAAIRRVHELIGEGRLGEVASFELHFSSDTGFALDEESWRIRTEAPPLLSMMQLGIHGIDLIHYLVGRIARVAARARSVTTPPGVVDNVAAVMETTNGVPGTLVSNYCSPVEFSFRIAGTEGTLHGTPLSMRFDPRGEGAGEKVDTSDRPFGSYIAQMVVFGDAVKDRSRPETDGRGGVQALAVVEAMAKSAESTEFVEVPPIDENVPTSSHAS